jgi:hypothetical protein
MCRFFFSASSFAARQGFNSRGKVKRIITPRLEDTVTEINSSINQQKISLCCSKVCVHEQWKNNQRLEVVGGQVAAHQN